VHPDTAGSASAFCPLNAERQAEAPWPTGCPWPMPWSTPISAGRSPPAV